jgi:hypothetical protein
MHFVLLWKTWFEGAVNTTWDFILVEHTNQWKSRDRSITSIIPSDIVEEVMLSMDPVRIFKFESENVHGLVLSALIEAENTENAIRTVLQTFPDAEILKCIPVLDHMLSKVRKTYESPDVSPG